MTEPFAAMTQPLESYVIRHNVRHGEQQRYLQLVGELGKDASAAEGFIDIQIDPPKNDERLCRTVFTFVSARHLARWRDSFNHRRLMAAMAVLIEETLDSEPSAAPRGRAWHAQPFAMFRWPPTAMPWWQRLLVAALLLMLFALLLPVILAGVLLLVIATLILRRRISSVMRRPFR